mgnify:CR=1 FL=1
MVDHRLDSLAASPPPDYRPVRPPESNPWWPLPHDYDTLCKEGQRAARVNSCTMRRTPEEFVAAWAFFRQTYLVPPATKEGFFYKRFVPSPPAHYQIIEDIARYPRNIHIAPRGSAKCLPAGQRVLLASGAWCPIEQLRVGDRVVRVDACDRLTVGTVRAVLAAGYKEVFEVRLGSGFKVRATAEHKLRRLLAWTPVSGLQPMDRIATLRGTGLSSLTGRPAQNDEAYLLGLLVGDGSLDASLRFTNADDEAISAFQRICAARGWGVRKVGRSKYTWTATVERRRGAGTPTEWLRRHALMHCTRLRKHTPLWVMSSSDPAVVTSYLRGYFDTDGTVSKGGNVELTSICEHLTCDVQLLLLSIGIRSRVNRVKTHCNGVHGVAYKVTIQDTPDRQRFSELVGFGLTYKQQAICWPVNRGNNGHYDVIPPEWRSLCDMPATTLRKAGGPRIDNGYGTTRDKLRDVADRTGSAVLQTVAASDLRWDDVLSITSVGHAATYDIQVDDGANFICEGVVTHNSTVITQELNLLLALTRPYASIFNAFSVSRLVTFNLMKICTQFEQNERIVEDFGPQRPGRMAARRIWSTKEGLLTLRNGGTIEAVPVDGRKRGARPDFIFLDDPEYDPEHEASETDLSKHLESLLFHQLLPMLDADEQHGQTFTWIGTLINRASALNKVMFGDDPRFEWWNRRMYAAESVDPDTGARSYFWPQKWDADALAKKREVLGDAAYDAEMQSNPRSAQACIFHLDPQLDMYNVSGDVVTSHRGVSAKGQDAQLCTVTWTQFLSELAILFVIDLAHRPGPTSDFNCCLVVGIDHLYDWWALDLIASRTRHDVFIRDVLALGAKWRPAIVGVEDAAAQALFGGWMESAAREAAGWLPRLMHPIRYPAKLSKEDRIGALSPRADTHRIHLPAYRKQTWPFTMMFEQFERFTPDGQSLSYDDVIDCFAMIPYCPRIRARGPNGEAIIDNSLYALMARGEANDPITGLPLSLFPGFAEAPADVMDSYLDKRRQVVDAGVDEPRTSALTRQAPGRNGPVGRVRPLIRTLRRF